MKYMAIIYGNKEMWAAFPPEVAAKAIGEVDAFNRRYTESGELLGAYGLADQLMEPGQAAHPGGRGDLLDAAAGRDRRAAAGGPARALPDLQRGVHDLLGRPDQPRRPEAEAIRLTRSLHRVRPGDGEVAGLLALMLLTEARRARPVDPFGELVSLADQDRSRWDRDLIAEGVALVSAALAAGPVGAYQLQAAIAAVHSEAPSAAETDWAEVLALYELLDRVTPNPMATVNCALAVAMAMVHGPAAGLELLAALDGDSRVARHHRLLAMRGHLLEMAGSGAAARAAFEEAARRTASAPEKRYLLRRAQACSAVG